ncbi:MAG: nucleotidyltransferase domain-containing protein, partial [Dolichospermum sp.]
SGFLIIQFSCTSAYQKSVYLQDVCSSKAPYNRFLLCVRCQNFKLNEKCSAKRMDIKIMISTNKQLTQQPLSLQNILKLFQEQVQYLYGNNLKQVILFGSYARGDFTSDSDIDILIVTQKKLSKPEREQLINFISDVSINDDILINFIEMLTQKFELEQSPLLLNIRREGVIL